MTLIKDPKLEMTDEFYVENVTFSCFTANSLHRHQVPNLIMSHHVIIPWPCLPAVDIPTDLPKNQPKNATSSKNPSSVPIPKVTTIAS